MKHNTAGNGMLRAGWWEWSSSLLGKPTVIVPWRTNSSSGLLEMSWKITFFVICILLCSTFHLPFKKESTGGLVLGLKIPPHLYSSCLYEKNKQKKVNEKTISNIANNFVYKEVACKMASDIAVSCTVSGVNPTE